MIERLVDILRPLPLPKYYRVLNPLVPAKGTRRARVHGAVMELDLEDLIQRRIYVGCYERVETRKIRSCLRPGATVIDVGANVGYFTAVTASAVGLTGRVISIEPNPHAFAKLARMVETTPLPQCHVHQIGLSDRAGSLTLYELAEEHHNLDSSMAPTEGSTGHQVAVRTLDECVEEWKLDRIDLLKIDVEGHESNVFAGAAVTLRQRQIKSILCEFNEYWLRAQGSGPEDLWATLISAGFRTEAGSDRPPQFVANYLETHLFRLAV